MNRLDHRFPCPGAVSGPGSRGIRREAARPIPAVLLTLVSLLSLLLSPEAAPAQSRDSGGLLQEVQSRLGQASGVELWEEARRAPSAAAAVPLMEYLAGRTEEPLYTARAVLWLGHYHYGAGQIEAALQYFEKAQNLEGNPGARGEARFWASQCRNLLGLEPAAHPVGPAQDDQADFFLRLAELDGRLRLGDLDQALSGYLALEGQARRVRCLSPLYYRVGLILNAGVDAGEPLDRTLTQGWAAAVAGSPERALVADLVESARRDKASEAEAEAPAFAEPEPPLPGPVEALPPPVPSPEGAEGDEADDAPAGRPAGFYTVLLGEYGTREEARRHLEGLTVRGLSVRLDLRVEPGGVVHRIILGREESPEEAEGLARRLCQGLDWRIIRVER